jgi:hypothetical protein
MAIANDTLSTEMRVWQADDLHGQENVLLKALLRAGGNRTWIWGTGAAGQALLTHLRGLGVEPAGFLDGMPAATPGEIARVPVYPAHAVPAARTPEALIVIASSYADEIVHRMRVDGYWRSTILYWSGSAASYRPLESVVDSQELAALVRRETTAAILQLLRDVPSHPRNVNYAHFAVLQAAADSAAYLTRHLQGAVDLVSNDALLGHALSLSTIEGLVLEFGVAEGCSLERLASLTAQEVHGFDSFEGLPEDWTYFQKRGRFSRAGEPPTLGCQNVRLHKGWFDATLPPFLEAYSGNVRFMHVDCDLYSSTATALRALRDRIVPGTIIVFDEYLNYPGWREHEHKAFAEFVREASVRYRYVAFASSGESVAVQILAD